MNYNYHTHTYICNHAEPSMEEYIKRAIDNGIKYMGFSEHIPFVFPDGFVSDYRISYEDTDKYISELKELREKYKDAIDIKIGFEMEYYPKYFDEMLEIAKKYKAEYLILGQHFIGNQHPDGYWSGKETDNEEILKEYVSTVVTAIKSGVFTYVAHPDLINYTGDEKLYISEMSKLCKVSLEYNVPLEINFLGIRDNRSYPRELFWKIAGEIKSPVTFGFDAHDVMSAYDEDSLEKAKKLVEKYKLNYIGKAEIKSI